MAQARRAAGLTLTVARRPGVWAALSIPLLAALGAIAYGVAGYVLLFGWSFIDGLFMTITTMTTVGYREIRPLGTPERLFTISLLVLGVSVLLMTLSIAASLLIEDPIRERIRRRRMNRRIEDLREHFIVCGYGRVGRTVAETLAAEDRPFVVIDRNEERAGELADAGVLFLTGDATERDDLMKSGLLTASALISAVDDDAENIFITMVARDLKPDLWIVARASQENTIDRLRTAGANRVYSPFVTAGHEMATAAVNPGVVDFIEVKMEGLPSLRLEEFEVEPGSHLVGRRLSDVKRDAHALAVRRRDGSILAPPDTGLTLEEGDILVLLGEREALRPLEQT